jgi:biotin-(acetyl-CoA carboxylase) ligase
VTHHGDAHEGLAEDIDDTGNLLLRRDDGDLLTLTAGDITLRTTQPAAATALAEGDAHTDA